MVKFLFRGSRKSSVAKHIYSLRDRVKLRAESKLNNQVQNEVSLEKRNILYDIIGFIFILLAGILLISFITMNINDTNIINKDGGGIARNLLGAFGANISAYSFLAFGYASYIVPIAFIYSGVRLIFKNSNKGILNISLTSASIMISISILLDVILYKFNFYQKGGLMGEMLHGGLKSIFGNVGTVIIVFASLVITFLMSTKRSLSDILLSFKSKVLSVKVNKLVLKDKYKRKEKNRIVSAMEYVPIIYKKDVTDLEYKISPFIEKVSAAGGSYDFDKSIKESAKYSLNREGYTDKSTRIKENNENKNELEEKYASYTGENRIDNIIESMRNINKNETNNDIRDDIRTVDYDKEDFGTTLAETIFGKKVIVNSSYKPVYNESNTDDKKEEIYKEDIESVYDYKTFFNVDYDIKPNRKEDFKKSIYESSLDNYPKYNVYKDRVLGNNLNKEEYIKFSDECAMIDNDPYENIDDNRVESIRSEELKEKEIDILDRLKAEMEKNRKMKDSITDREPFEFSMGYAMEKEYNRADHIPGAKDKNEDNENNVENLDVVDFEEYTENNFNNEDILTQNDKGFKDNNSVSFDKNNDNLNENDFINIENNEKIEDINKPNKVFRKGSVQTKDTQYAMRLPTYERIQSNFDSKYVDKHYKSPSLDLLNRSIPINDNAMLEAIKQTAIQLENTLLDFSVEAHVTGVSRGPVVTRYELELAAGTRVSKISNLTDNIALALASESVRIIAPIPGRSVIGIEIPNKVRNAVYLREVLESSDFKASKSDIPFVLGKGIYGNNIVTDLSDAPHLLVAGTTGSGKSVCLSTIILSLLYKFRPDELKFIFVDKKRVELSIYNGIPHLMSPVVSDEKKATVVLRHIVDIMERRYERMERFFVRNVKAYNEKVYQLMKDGESEFEGEPLELFPYIVVVIDELHNLMVVASKEVEDLISRLAGMSRAVGIHLIIATQRPSADVVTGVIKANLPTRIAFQVPNKTNSRIIIDMAGAEQLLGKGDALFCSSGNQMPERVQGAFVSDGEVKKVVDYLSSQMAPSFDESLISALEKSDNDDRNTDEEDILDEELWEDAVRTVARTGKASASFLQRKLKIGYNRAARIVEIMERQGIVGPENGSKPREVLISYED